MSPGASAVLLELSVPYSEGATQEYLGSQPPGEKWGYCSAGAARELAEVCAFSPSLLLDVPVLCVMGPVGHPCRGQARFILDPQHKVLPDHIIAPRAGRLSPRHPARPPEQRRRQRSGGPHLHLPPRPRCLCWRGMHGRGRLGPAEEGPAPRAHLHVHPGGRRTVRACLCACTRGNRRRKGDHLPRLTALLPPHTHTNACTQVTCPVKPPGADQRGAVPAGGRLRRQVSHFLRSTHPITPLPKTIFTSRAHAHTHTRQYSKATLAALLETTHPASPSSSITQSWFARLPLGPHPAAAAADQALPITAPQDEQGSVTGHDALDALASADADRALFVPSTASTNGLRAFPFPPGVPLLPLGKAPTIVYPGSFNPLHDGHLTLARVAQQALVSEGGNTAPAATVLFEIATVNADKGAVDRATLEARLRQFGSGEKGQAVVLTRTPLFVEKARLFPGAHFLIGADTVKVHVCVYLSMCHKGVGPKRDVNSIPALIP